MTLKKVLEDYITAQNKFNRIKHELGEAETRLEMECRRMWNCSDKIIDGNLKMLANILLGKLQ